MLLCETQRRALSNDSTDFSYILKYKTVMKFCTEPTTFVCTVILSSTALRFTMVSNSRCSNVAYVDKIVNRNDDMLIEFLITGLTDLKCIYILFVCEILI